MQKIKCIIVEDEPLAVRILKDYISQEPILELVEVFKDAISAKSFLQAENVSLMFLDIHLPKVKGVDFLKSLLNPPVVIITTAYHQYALESFELNVADYLMKPISNKRFSSAVNKAIKLISANDSFKKNQDQAIYLNVNRRKVKILLNDILYVESKREYVMIVTHKDEYLSKIGTAELEELLPPERFRRIHRSFIIAVDKVNSFSKENVEINGIKIPIGKNYKKEFIM
ncbi:LytTR family DNA-binding domain-containing protein [Lacibacter sp.]|uniref:LytR/AlgR family response regulator transcription factor n=1 Tax=Lacibacter sp. TaxID=1915409 RepID=UPI002B4AEAFC|nr:LytTR family DNA-binding domain-containing protein [Lacibacter sp.]HLP38966.1 LytTR family DNA-binding domain-containing protein [Lacibacter sp.]